MASNKKASQARVCPKTGRPINAGKYHWVRWVLPLTGLMSLLWFLVRVIPKPSRASYPCQRMAVPLASGFVVWLLGIISSSLAYRKARQLWKGAKYTMAAACAGVAVMSIWLSLSITNSDPASAAFTPSEPPNSPMGVARGIHPGRVVWVHDPAVTSWDGFTGRWWDDENTNQDVVDYMVSEAIQTLTGQTDDEQAWTALFRHFNQTHGFGDAGYQYGEKISIKINMNQDAGSAWGPADGMPSPQVVYSFLDQLINMVGVPGSAITVYDASRYIGDPIYDKVRSNPDPNFQSVTFVVSPVVARNGRLGAIHDQDNPIYTEAGIAYLPRCVTQAKYLINMALLRPHELYGITLCAKNHFGSVRFLSTSTYQGWTPSPLHNYGLRSNLMGSYNCLVELNGHRHLGGKTLLYFIDALYSAVHQGGNVIEWESLGDDWCSSVFASQDPVAIDSVGLDFLRNEPRCTNVTGYPENYLHEMALADNPPSGTFYDPERDGIRLASLGVHEHWNNPVDKQYSRNLGIGDGIELVVPPLASEDGPVQNVTQGTRYDFISHAVQEANDGDEIVVAQGVYQESLDFGGKAVTVRSENPNDPGVVAATVIDGGSQAVAFTTGEGENSKLVGLTLTGATQGVYCRGSAPTIRNCCIVDNVEAGIKLWDSSNPTIVNCVIAGNGGDGIEMWASKSGRNIAVNSAHIVWCTIVGNSGSGIHGGEPVIVNTIVYSNGVNPTTDQIACDAAIVGYCDVEGGMDGTGNIDADPGFVTAGLWADPVDPTLPATPGDPAAVWIHGDYHLRSDSPCVDAGDPTFIPDGTWTDIDGQPRVIGGSSDIGCDEVLESADTI
jgi:parallel beta-helix repeat protein